MAIPRWMCRPPGLVDNKIRIRWLTPPAKMFRPQGCFFRAEPDVGIKGGRHRGVRSASGTVLVRSLVPASSASRFRCVTGVASIVSWAGQFLAIDLSNRIEVSVAQMPSLKLQWIESNQSQGASSMGSAKSTTIDTTSKINRWDRSEISKLLQRIRFDQDDGMSLNQSASQGKGAHAKTQRR
jgi:hypothetical protein